jgi:hypothetical protein
MENATFGLDLLEEVASEEIPVAPHSHRLPWRARPSEDAWTINQIPVRVESCAGTEQVLGRFGAKALNGPCCGESGGSDHFWVTFRTVPIGIKKNVMGRPMTSSMSFLPSRISRIASASVRSGRRGWVSV